jgi:hypothetical protein
MSVTINTKAAAAAASSFGAADSSPNKLKIYYRADYDKIKNDGFTFILSPETIDAIKSISSKVGAPEYIKTPHFEKRAPSKQRGYVTQEITDAEWDNLRSFQATVIEKKKGIELSIDQIRKHLNKMTAKTYDNLKVQIINEINTIVQATSENDDLSKIGDALFTIASGNSFYSGMYAKLYKELMNDYQFLQDIFTNSLNTFSAIFTDFAYCDPNKDYDKFCQNNKINEKRRALGLFYVNLMLENIIPVEKIVTIIEDLQSYLSESIKKVDNTNICEELTELIFIIITNSSSRISKNEDDWTNIVRRVNMISNLKPKAEPSISNKTVFKHMDILEFVNKAAQPPAAAAPPSAKPPTSAPSTTAPISFNFKKKY